MVMGDPAVIWLLLFAFVDRFHTAKKLHADTLVVVKEMVLLSTRLA
jgi:hypothetical protein